MERHALGRKRPRAETSGRRPRPSSRILNPVALNRETLQSLSSNRWVVGVTPVAGEIALNIWEASTPGTVRTCCEQMAGRWGSPLTATFWTDVGIRLVLTERDCARRCLESRTRT